MKSNTVIALVITHIIAGILGFAIGIYALPILTAPPAPDDAMVVELSTGAKYTAQFRRDLADSDAFHWGEGTVSLGTEAITFVGELAPGPDYMLYLSPEFVETEADFNRLKASMVRVGDIKTFENFIVETPDGIDLERYNSVIVWCESFSEFITSAKYQ